MVRASIALNGMNGTGAIIGRHVLVSLLRLFALIPRLFPPSDLRSRSAQNPPKSAPLAVLPPLGARGCCYFGLGTGLKLVINCPNESAILTAPSGTRIASSRSKKYIQPRSAPPAMSKNRFLLGSTLLHPCPTQPEITVFLQQLGGHGRNILLQTLKLGKNHDQFLAAI